ncbi:hypothetical protein E2C01_006973 [Portunus trituberculatus]|uniref:Uncharacterized protein n=1 Tax=Portunus trituberculatus TaxID=210409 RepID=A0A5B7D389_PORTR|nr:hypothetical protein [Portunus trituberculatus]
MKKTHARTVSVLLRIRVDSVAYRKQLRKGQKFPLTLLIGLHQLRHGRSHDGHWPTTQYSHCSTCHHVKTCNKTNSLLNTVASFQASAKIIRPTILLINPATTNSMSGPRAHRGSTTARASAPSPYFKEKYHVYFTKGHLMGLSLTYR